MNITVSDKIVKACGKPAIAILECEVQNSPTSNELWNEIGNECEQITQTYKLDEINKRPEIAATRKAYKALGKDPNRYRPSAEALCRRIVKDMPLYRASTLVDVINLVSIKSGFSIGGFDMERIAGSDLELSVGTTDDEFQAIGRGMLNIEGLPVYRDAVGGIGIPTSDCERTKITDKTTRLLMIVNGYSGEEKLSETIDYAIQLFQKYAFIQKQDIKYLL